MYKKGNRHFKMHFCILYYVCRLTLLPNTSITVDGTTTRQMGFFIYLGNVVDWQGGYRRNQNPYRTSILTQSQFFSMDVRHGGQQRWCRWRLRRSSTSPWGASIISVDQRRLVTKICGSEQDQNQWPSSTTDTPGLDIPSGSWYPAAHAKPWPGTHWEKGREGSPVTTGGKATRQKWNN